MTRKCFKPDFALVRQNLRDANEDHRNILLGLMYGGIASVNNLTAIYNFQDKPWVFAHLMGLQRRLGKENFPLIEQMYYPNHQEMWEEFLNIIYPYMLCLSKNYFEDSDPTLDEEITHQEVIYK
ncbi:hypothetical protein KQX54_014621 [Cotesia glomerata]|uniref:Uncharacterized protein n=1 Tax=Cotesia glomerata TaxID=32391 RepID=A0AAV7IDK3_COTGL|nr:hypothetical protein KQX54_014621 [Cotesia glomerata]